MFKEYGKLSSLLYEKTKPVGFSIGGDIAYYQTALKNKTGKILEAGVGTGRMLIPLLQAGLDVEGVDLSADMLHLCQTHLEKENLTAKLYHQDLTCLTINQTYQSIIMPTGSFCLIEREQVLDVLTHFYRLLEPNGELIIDIDFPVDFLPGQVESYHLPLSKEKGILFTSHSHNIHWHKQTYDYYHHYDLIQEGQVIETEVSHFGLSWYGVTELDYLLKAAGFTTIKQVPGYNQHPEASLITIHAIK